MSRTRSFVVVSLVLSGCLALNGCTNKDAGTDAKAETKADDAPAPAPAQPEQPAAPSTTAVEPAAESETGEAEEPAPPLPATFDEIGVAACDEYVAAHVACIDAKMPEAEREAARRVVFENLEAWKQTASGGASAQKGLETGCRIAREQAKRATQDLGCDW